MVDLNRLREDLKNGRLVTVNRDGRVQNGTNSGVGTATRPKTFA